MNMPRYYAKKLSIDYDDVLVAIKKINILKHSVRSVADAHNIPKTNLLRYLDKFKEAKVDVSLAPDDLLKDILKSSSKAGKKPVSYFDYLIFYYVLLCFII